MNRLVLIVALVLGSAACDAPRDRVLIVGIDGATLRITDPLIEKGELPNLAKISRQGTHGKLRSRHPLMSPPVWTTIATGRRRGSHGVLGFKRMGEDGKERLYSSADRRVHALWNIISRSDRSVGVVNWWTTHPVEVVRGVMISDHAMPGHAERYRKFMKMDEAEAEPSALTFPPEWQERISDLLSNEEPLTDFSDPFIDNTALPRWSRNEFMSRVFHDDETTLRIALAVETETRPDVLMVLLTGIDRVSHTLWGTVDTDVLEEMFVTTSPEQIAAGREAIDEYYRYTDALIGLLLAHFDDDDLVVVVSDHGFESGRTNKMPGTTGEHLSDAARDGVIFVRGRNVGDVVSDPPLNIEDVAPTVLAWLGIPVSEDLDGKVAPFFTGPPPATRPTWEDQPIERLSGGHSGAEKQILEDLQGLGYFE